MISKNFTMAYRLDKSETQKTIDKSIGKTISNTNAAADHCVRTATNSYNKQHCNE